MSLYGQKTDQLEIPNPLAQTQTALTVEQLNLNIKQLIEGQLGTVWVQGEISNFKAHTSGHYYFTLKDQKSQISAVMFRGHNSKLRFRPADGLEVILRGRVTVYEPRGNYQILCEMMEPVGAGALQKAFEQLKEKLKTEGLFDPSRKKALPLFPNRIAVVTSPTGAAIQDILNIMSRRAMQVEVIVVPTVVQGADASPRICEAFALAQKIKDVDAIIIGRGGGSMEDLWCFNDETLARMIAACKIPVISAVGHEIDFTICDFVADLRAPTPSAAAELVAKSSVEVARKIADLQRFLTLSFKKNLEQLKQKALLLHARLIDPQKKLEDLRLRNDDLLSRLQFALQKNIEQIRYQTQILKARILSPQILIDQKKQKLVFLKRNMSQLVTQAILENRKIIQHHMMLLDSLSPLKVVDRGYSILKTGSSVVKSIDQVKVGDELQARVTDGELDIKVIAINKFK